MSYLYWPTINKLNAIKELNTTNCKKQIQENTLAIETNHLYNSVLTAIQIQEFIVVFIKTVIYLLVALEFPKNTHDYVFVYPFVT